MTHRRDRKVLLLIGVTILTLGAGMVAGLLAARLPMHETPKPDPEDRSPLVQELGLSAEQSELMRDIWEGVRTKVHETFEEAKSLGKQRDDAIMAMLTDEQKAKFETLSKDFADRYTALETQRRKLFDQAVADTKVILTEQQRTEYDELLRKRALPGGPPGLPPPTMSKPENHEHSD